MPLYNEATCLQGSFARIEAYLTGLQLPYEVILVNDGSTDGTESICDAIVNSHPCTRMATYPVNRGKGYAVKTGILHAVAKYVIFTDADLAVPVRFIGTCLQVLEKGIPMVIGSRHLPESRFRVREGVVRQALGEIFRRFAKISLDLKASDITCGLKGFTRDAAVAIFSRSRIDRWGYDAEILFLAQRLGFDIKEVPVEWYHSFDSKVNVGADSVGTLLELIRIRYYCHRRLYDC
jgi:glycosyltransferase involved in cell wall biosynthesis